MRRYIGPAGLGSIGQALAVDGSGNVYVTGCSDGGGTGYDCATIKYYSNGDTAWVSRYDGGQQRRDFPSNVAVDGCGNVYVTGYSLTSYGTWSDYATIKYYPNGDTAWVRRYGSPGYYNDYSYDIAVDNSGNVYVTGRSLDEHTGPDYATIKYVPFFRGDANRDWKITLSDCVYLISYLYKGGTAPYPLSAGDANCDGTVTLSDIVFLISYLYKGAPAPCS